LQLIIVSLQYDPFAKVLDKGATLKFNILKFINLTPSKELTIKAILKQLYAYTRGLKTRQQQAFIANI
jgi:hypothetical protein